MGVPRLLDGIRAHYGTLHTPDSQEPVCYAHMPPDQLRMLRKGMLDVTGSMLRLSSTAAAAAVAANQQGADVQTGANITVEDVQVSRRLAASMPLYLYTIEPAHEPIQCKHVTAHARHPSSLPVICQIQAATSGR